MKPHWYLVLIIFLLVSPVIAIDTSNWVNATSDNGIYFEMPSYWAWDPIDPTTVAIRTEKSDAALLISYIPRNSRVPGSTDANVTEKAKKELSDLHVPDVDNVTYNNMTVTASGKTESGMIVNLTEKFEINHTCRWVSEYSDHDAIVKYADTILTIIRSTKFNQTSL